uniref:Uncharacterized protein n=1 Tax=Glossina austeni TaxID=7395 RepID=A0A1A9VPP8_GLOAU
MYKTAACLCRIQSNIHIKESTSEALDRRLNFIQRHRIHQSQLIIVLVAIIISISISISHVFVVQHRYSRLPCFDKNLQKNVRPKSPLKNSWNRNTTKFSYKPTGI